MLPLNDGDLTPQSSSREVKVTSPHSTAYSLVQILSDKLCLQNINEEGKRKSALTSAEADLRSLLSSNSGPVALTNLGSKWEAYIKALKRKSDRDKSGSTWTIKTLKKYLLRSDIVFIRSELLFTSQQVRENIQGSVALSLAALCGNQGNGIDGNLPLFHGMRDSTEGDSRMILDAILQPLCAAMGLALRCEQSLTCNHLPDNRYDYIIYYKNKPIGVVEAKRQRCVNDRSVAQLIVQLLLLSAENSRVFRFGVLSDAHRFILAGVSENKVVFFQTRVQDIEIRFMKSTEDLLSIAFQIKWLIDLAVKSREKNRSIERYLRQIDNACFKLKPEFYF